MAARTARIFSAVIGLALVVGAVGVPRASDNQLAGVVRVAGRPHKDVVVWLDGVTAPAPPAPSKVVLDQRNLQFLPHVLAVRAGTRVEMPNSDRVFHNVFSFHDGKKFDLGLYPVGTVKVVHFDQPGVSRIFCNIHPNMAAYLVVVDSAFFAVSDRDGRFAIRGVPRGTYTWHAWRAGSDTRTGQITVEPGRPIDVGWP